MGACISKSDTPRSIPVNRHKQEIWDLMDIVFQDVHHSEAVNDPSWPTSASEVDIMTHMASLGVTRSPWVYCGENLVLRAECSESVDVDAVIHISRDLREYITISLNDLRTLVKQDTQLKVWRAFSRAYTGKTVDSTYKLSEKRNIMRVHGNSASTMGFTIETTDGDKSGHLTAEVYAGICSRAEALILWTIAYAKIFESWEPSRGTSYMALATVETESIFKHVVSSSEISLRAVFRD